MARRSPGLDAAVADPYAHATGAVFVWVIPVAGLSAVATLLAARDARELRTGLHPDTLETVL